MKKELQIGDLVKVNGNVSEYMFAGLCGMKEGEILKIKNIINDAKLRLLNETDGSRLVTRTGYELSDGRIYFKNWIDFVENEKVKNEKVDFKLSDLKDGQLVEIRSGATFIKFGKMLIEVSDAHFLQLDSYDNDLNFHEGQHNVKNLRYDIVEVYDSNNAKHVISVHGEKSLAAELMSKDDRKKELKKVWSR